MTMAQLEHANITVGDIDRTAAWLEQVFGWGLRWRGPAIHGGESAHMGTEGAYVALYSPPGQTAPTTDSYAIRGGLNHIGVVVGDLDKAEAAVQAAGFTPHNHADYEPGRRFYFHDDDGIEWEVVSYHA